MSDALLAALMMQQRPQVNQADRQRAFAESLMRQGASTEPVQHWSQGLSRALQGVLGAGMSVKADSDQKDMQKRTMEGLAAALAAPDAASRAEAMKGLSGDPNILAPFLASTLSQKIADERKNGILDTKLNAAGVGGGAPTLPPGAPGLGGASGGPLTIDINKPLPNQSVAPGGFNNNVGNIRASNINWDGKGAPHNGFETFATPQQGVNAAFRNLSAYAQQNPNMTVAQAIAKWAPPNENNTQQYITQVAEGTGINPGMPLAEVLKDPAVGAQLLDAITRKEKGGLPQGVTADTFMAATGRQAAPAQVAQGGGDASGNPVQQQAPQQPSVTALPEISPAAQALAQQAQQARAGGDRERALALMQKAQEAQAAYVQERAKTQDTRGYEASQTEAKRAYEQQEHDRREATKTMTKEQSDAATFADRMVMSESIFGKPVDEKGTALANQQGTSAKGKLLDTTVFGVGIPGSNYAQSKEYQQYKQAAENFTYAILRRETGAAIQPFEQEVVNKQYLPQPGDNPEVLAQKAQNRRVAIEGMTRAAGPTYKPTQTATETPAAAPPSSASGVQEGATATNPQTGEKIVFRGGKWGPQ